MGFFDIFKKKRGFNLKEKDFTVKVHNINAVSIKVSKDFHEKFGHLLESDESNKDFSVATAKVNFGNQRVELTYFPNDVPGEVPNFLKLLNDHLDWISENQTKINLVLTTELLPLKNSSWLEESENPLTESEFLKKAELNSIHFNGDTLFSMNFSDGDMFGGHSMVVEVGIDHHFIKGKLEG